MAPTELNMTLEVALDLGAELGEGPVWDEESQQLIFVDSALGKIYRFDPESKALSNIELGCEIGIAIPRRGGGLVVSSVNGLLLVKADGSQELLVPVEQDLTDHRMNDAKCDSRGRLFSGTFSQKGERGAGALYRIDEDLTLTPLVSGITVSNGIAWNPDETVLYYVDTRTRRIDRFDYDIGTGTIANRARFVDIDRLHGLPDGMCVDAEAHIWLALYRGSEVRRYAPDGSLAARVTLPVSGVTSCTFGGPDLTDLYITTARLGIDSERLREEPYAGALFRCRPGMSGLPSHKFGSNLTAS